MQQHGYVTVKNGGRLNANMPIYSDSRTLITGEASVYSNINVGAYGLMSFQRDATVSNIVFEIADGAKFENLGRMDISGAGGNKVVFRGTKTDQTARHGTETSGFSVVEVGNALEVVDGAKLRLTTGSGAAHGNCRIRLYGDLLVSGENGLLSFNTTTAMMVGALRSPTSRITVADGAKFEVGGGLNLGADGGTNACLSVTNGGVVTAAGVYLGYASNDPKYEQAPHDCVIDVAGSGSKLTCSGLTVGTGEKASADATGCCTNGYGNILRVRDGAQVVNSVDLTIGNTCSSNALEVLSGGRLEARNVYIGRAESAVIGPTKAQFCAIGNRCVVAGGGAVEATGLLSIRGNDSSCFMTNGVLHTTMTNNFECMANTGHLVIAGTNSLLKGDLATRIIAVSHHILVARHAQQRTMAEVTHHAVIFHFTQSHQLGDAALAHGRYYTCHVIHLLPIAPWRPVANPVGQEFLVVLQAVMGTVKQVLRVVEHHPHPALSPGCLHHLRCRIPVRAVL